MKKIIFLLLMCFTVFYTAQAQMSSGSFATKVDISTGGASYQPLFSAAGDIDGDGKTDIVVPNGGNSNIVVFRNTATPGSINSSDLTLNSFATLSGPQRVCIGDIDGDNKKDIVLTYGSGTQFSIFLNTSTSGAISFAVRLDFSASSAAGFVSLGDIDSDGKLDIICLNFSTNNVCVYKNTTASGTISFATPYCISTGAGPAMSVVRDFDGDGKPDIATSDYNSNTTVSIFRNTTTSSISFSSPTSLTVGMQVNGLSCGDFNNDGKIDILGANYGANTISILRNNSTSGSFSFATKVDISTPASSNPQEMSVADFDQDTKMDIVVANKTSNNISVFRNFDTATVTKVINANTFHGRTDFTTGTASSPSVIAADIDGDGKQDIISTNTGTGTISVFRNLIIPSNGLMAYYPFTGNAGDSSGFGNDGIVAGATLTTDRFGVANSAYSFTAASNNSISISPANLLLNTYTYSLWVNANTLPPAGTGISSYRSPFSIGNSTADQFLMLSNASPAGFGYGSYYSSSAGNGYTTGTLPSTNTWYHLAVTRSTDSLKFYINGILIDVRKVSSGSAAYGPSPNYAIIGARAGASLLQFFEGKIDEVRIYNRALNFPEIQVLAGIQPQQPAINYYSNATGYLDSLNTWGTNTDGSGTHPLSFDSSNTIYNVVNNASPTQSADWMITGVNTAIVFGDGSNSINMSVPAGLICGSDSMYIRNGVTYTVDGTLFYNKLNLEDGSTVQYLSTGTETLIPVSYSNLVVYGGTKSISGNTTIRGTLAMIADIDCGGDTLTLGSSASQTGSLNYTSGSLTGAFSRWFAATTNTGSTGLFPLGTSAQYNPIQVDYTSTPTNGGVLTAVFTSPTSGTIRFPAIIDFSISPAVSLKKVSPDGFWTITPSKGLTGGTYKAIATATGFSGISNILGLRLLRRDNSSSAWTLPSSSSAIAVTGSTSSPVVGRSGLATATGSRDFGIAADSTVNPLPVELIRFEGNQASDNSVLLNWVTSQEFNNDHFEIERLIKAQWNSIGRIKGNSNSTQTSVYSFIDKEAFPNNTTTIYYRLKQVDINGNYEYSNVISVVLNKTKQESRIIVYPNPSSSIITIQGLQQEAIIKDIVGNEVMRIKSDGEINITELKQGIYFIQSGSEMQKLIKH